MIDTSLNQNQSIDEQQYTPLVSKEVWFELESNRQLLEPRKQVISSMLRLISALALVFYTPFVMVLGWLLLIFGANAWMRRFLRAYAEVLARHPNPSSTSPEVAEIVRGYKYAWLFNCVVWGLLSGLSQFWLPEGPRFVCIIILNALMFLSITRTHVDRWLMHRVTAIFIGSQLIFLIMRFIYIGDYTSPGSSDPHRLVSYLIYLALMSYLLWIVGNRFEQMHHQHLNSEYSKLQLIETLNLSKAQLRLEQQALVASNKLVQQFYSGAAHDLRQPVYAMQLYASMLSDDASLGKVLLPKITQSCESINDMFNTLFDYQQTHMNDTELVEKDIKIKETFRSLALHFQPIAAGKGLEIRFRPIAGSITMVPLYLARILSNLISNALRYTTKGGVLVVARKTNLNLQFEVWDTGIGIDDSKKQHIFNEFYKVNDIEIDNEGLGLGLAIAKQLSARIPKSEISVRSRMGRGSVFTFTVPLDRYKAHL
jgi:signal transduction histidine kinase